MEKYTKDINKFLNKIIKPENLLQESMRYTLLAKSKLVRARLLLHFFELCSLDSKKNTNIDSVLPYAAAVEMVHTFSLIHDDLPCMDNDDMRRGKPANHKVYGEDIAMLAGDALLNLAYEIMLDPANLKSVGLNQAVAAAKILADAVGSQGMALGQVLDLDKSKEKDLKYLENIYNKKTTCLISAACLMGVKLAAADKKYEKIVEDYAANVGLAFQIMDDILDITSDEKTLGKPIGSDKINEKITYVDLLGLDQARTKVKKLTDYAVNLLKCNFGQKSDDICNLTQNLINRSN